MILKTESKVTKVFNEIPKHLQDLEKRKEKLKRAHDLLKKNNRKDINLTDEESCTMLHRHFVPEPSYNGQIAVEAESGLIVAADLGNNPSDYWGLTKLTEQINENTNETPEQILADSGYASYENLKYLKRTKTLKVIFPIRCCKVSAKAD